MYLLLQLSRGGLTARGFYYPNILCIKLNSGEQGPAELKPPLV